MADNESSAAEKALQSAVDGYQLGSWADQEKMFADLSPIFGEAHHARLRELIAERAKKHDSQLE
ncbi:hypothetical protein [Sorangium sp. So ce388]|uniref:hypothetical protein n=1 Tax=Sorangium sp. So ce388 TaxID=3133309 RepID=UPI003F5C6F42